MVHRPVTAKSLPGAFLESTGGSVLPRAEAHTWKMPYRHGLYGYITDRGTLFYNGQIPNETFIGKSPFMGGAAMEADWNGKILWEIKQPDHHHDGRLLHPSGIAPTKDSSQPALFVRW